MNKLLTIFMSSSLITSCCCIYDKPDKALNDLQGEPERATKFETNSKYPGQFLACRADAAKEPIKKKLSTIILNIEKANSKGQHIVLYFHGGLSSQTYMTTDLGPKLMKNLFRIGAYENSVYPVFVNYDAGPEEIFKKEIFKFKDYENIWDKLKGKMKEKADQLENQLQEAGSKLKGKSGISLNLSSDTTELDNNQLLEWKENVSRAAAGYLKTIKLNSSSFVSFNENDIEEMKEDAKKIIRSNNLPQEYQQVLSTSLADRPLDIISNGLTKETSDSTNKLIGIDFTITDVELKLRLIRFIARLVLKTDHGFFATLQEEIWQVVRIDGLPEDTKLPKSLGEFANMHWDLVKEHSLQCISEGSAGKYIIDELLTRNITFNTLSHSAGAIPVSILLEYIAESGNQDYLEKAIMIVPAVSQKVFLKRVLDAKNDVSSKVFIYPLKEQYELADNVATDLLYSSSLLYAVSSLAEDQITLDQFLLIEQHLDNEVFPYNTSWYQGLTCEKPDDVWKFFFDEKHIKYYPSKKISNRCKSVCNVDYKKAATHGNTKFPSVSCDLASDYMEKLTDIKACPELNDLSITHSK